MTYNPEIPLVTESPDTSSSPIQVNFSQYNTIFSNLIAGVYYNHMQMNLSSQGKHGAVIFQKQTADPTVNQDQVDIYAKDATSNTSTEPQLFARIPVFLPTKFDTTQATNTPMQLTFNEVNTAGPVYQSFLPGGYLLYFGSVTDIAPAIVLTPQPSSILVALAFSNTLSTIGQPFPYTVSTQINGNTSFNIYSGLNPPDPPNPQPPYSFTWIAIGKA